MVLVVRGIVTLNINLEVCLRYMTHTIAILRICRVGVPFWVAVQELGLSCQNRAM